MNTCLIIPIAVGLISALLGYLLGRLFSKDRCKIQCDKLTQKITHLENELNACRKTKTSNKTQDSVGIMSFVFDKDKASAVFGRPIKENDLTVIEGIGPKIQHLFHNNNIKTWKSLSNCSVQKCQSILDGGGEAFRIHNPGTWPKQARLAYEGQWKKLLKWQDQLDGGR